MKDNLKLRSSWGVTSILSMLFPRGDHIKKGFWKFLLLILAGIAVLVIWGPVGVLTRISSRSPDTIPVNYEFQSNPVLHEKVILRDEDDAEVRQKLLILKQEEDTAPGLNMRPKWNTRGYRFLPKFSDWDKQRARLMKKNPSSRAPVGRQSRVMLVTSTLPTPCNRSIGSHLLIKSIKNKLDYSRVHDIEFYHNMATVDVGFDGGWGKVPLLRMLMVKHYEKDWFWWMDIDAVFTDMHFEVPFDKFTAEKKTLVVAGDNHRLHELKDYLGISTGGILIRNCQRSLDLLDAWASMGVKEVRDEAGKVLSEALKDRPEQLAADDQSSLAYLLIHESNRWASNVVLETSFTLRGHWVDLTYKYEEMMERKKASRPLYVLFSGCEVCQDIPEEFPLHTCVEQMQRTFDFADSQVLEPHGFKIATLGGSVLIPLNGWQSQLEIGKPYHMLPNVSDWDQQRQAYAKRSKDPRDKKGALARVLMVSGSSPKPCPRVEGTHFLLKALKNKIDYCRIHDVDFFYNMGNMDKRLIGWWGKVAVIRTMMLSHPEAEWIWWVDADAIFTDMIFEPPFEAYSGVNVVMWGLEDMVYKRPSFLGINSGDMLIRNCQWSLDLFDSIIPMGPDGPVREAAGRMLSKALGDRGSGMQADDQSALVYTFSRDKEKFAPKVRLENDFIMSGDWTRITDELEKLQDTYHPGLGDYRWPLITHFAGCQPCNVIPGNFPFEECIEEMDRTLHFADNQVIMLYGLQHQNLETWELQKLEKEAAAIPKATHSQQTFL